MYYIYMCVERRRRLISLVFLDGILPLKVQARNISI